MAEDRCRTRSEHLTALRVTHSAAFMRYHVKNLCAACVKSEKKIQLGKSALVFGFLIHYTVAFSFTLHASYHRSRFLHCTAPRCTLRCRRRGQAAAHRTRPGHARPRSHVPTRGSSRASRTDSGLRSARYLAERPRCVYADRCVRLYSKSREAPSRCTV